MELITLITIMKADPQLINIQQLQSYHLLTVTITDFVLLVAVLKLIRYLNQDLQDHYYHHQLKDFLKLFLHHQNKDFFVLPHFTLNYAKFLLQVLELDLIVHLLLLKVVKFLKLLGYLSLIGLKDAILSYRYRHGFR